MRPIYFLLLGVPVIAQPPPGTGVTCPDAGNYNGDSSYTSGPYPKAAPLRGNVACVDNTFDVSGPSGTVKAKNIYGPMEAGFTSAQLSQLFTCSTSSDIPGGLDTKIAEELAEHLCNKQIEILSDCGGHANPYHFHERFTCMFNSAASGHSSKFATALDGRGLYGNHESLNTPPSDLDACGGHTAVTPDSNGQAVYHYHVTDTAPFSLGCFGPATMSECRALYSGCSSSDTDVVLSNRTVKYKQDCPCFDVNGFNTDQPTVAPTAPTTAPAPTTSSDLSGGAVAAITIGSLLGAQVGVYLIYKQYGDSIKNVFSRGRVSDEYSGVA